MHTYQREPDEECARSGIYLSQKSNETRGICFLQSDQHKSSHRFRSSKTEQQDDDVKEIATETKVENVLYH